MDKYLHNCSKADTNLINCYYLKSLLGPPLYELLIDHSFNCYVSNATFNGTQYECTSQPKNNTNESIKIESSIESKEFDVISPTKPIIKEVESKSVDNITSDDSVSRFSEDSITSSITQTTSEVVSSLTEPSVLAPIVEQSSETSDKSEDLSTIQVINNEMSNENENIAKSEDLNKDITNNDNNQMPSQNQNGGSNGGYISTGSGMVQSKESVVIRLSNRIKALEVNLSLSSQYLEELSLRYRKQMEEMQRAFNITISKLNDTNIRAAERVMFKIISVFSPFLTHFLHIFRILNNRKASLY